MTARARRIGVGGAIAIATAIVAACTSYGNRDAVDVDAGVDASDGGVDAPSNEGCDAATYDLAGCRCATEGAIQLCYQGVPGPKSACKLQGTQSCVAAGGAPRWSSCSGGSTPTAEVCGNDVDDDCNGTVDDGCPCTPSGDICRPDLDAGAPFFPSGEYTFFTVPATLHQKQPFDLYVVTKDRVLTTPGLMRNPGGLCYGGGPLRACASPGADCVGWKVAHFQGLSETVASVSYDLYDPPGVGGCDGSKVAVSPTFTLAP